MAEELGVYPGAQIRYIKEMPRSLRPRACGLLLSVFVQKPARKVHTSILCFPIPQDAGSVRFHTFCYSALTHSYFLRSCALSAIVAGAF